VAALAAASAMVDGEAVWCDADGLAIFDKLHSRAYSGILSGRLDRRGAVLHSALYHLPQIGRVLMLMNCDCVLDGCLQQFGFAVGTQSDRAVHFTWECATVDELAAHDFLRILD
jgi:hypothetical protein